MHSVNFEGHTPTVSSSAWVAPTATLVGEVTVADNAVILFGAVVRADRAAITVGPGSNLQDNVVVHADPGFDVVIGAGVSVGHGAVVHGAVVGDNTLVGMNATVLNGARIGKNCIIAAGSVVLEGADIPDGSLVAGTPGTLRRPTTEPEHAAIRANAETYRVLGVTYASSPQ